MIANRLAGVLVLGSALALVSCGGEGLTLPPEGEAAHISVIAGDGQSGRVGSTLAEPLVVQVTDTRDRPVAGANVVFGFTGGSGGETSPASAATDADGRASTSLTLGTTVGPATGTAEVPVDPDITPVRTTFTATALSDDANGIALVSGDGQTGQVGTALAQPLVVEVTDAFDNPIAGVTVTWTANGGGSVSDATTQTGSNGQASVTRTLGPTAGEQTTSASAEGLAGSPVTFTHTATAGSATGVVKVSGDGQSALAGTELADPLVVQVLDAQSNPIPGRAVTWIVTDGGGSVSSQNSTTDAQGFASTRWTLGPVAGPNAVNAVVSGVGTATFNATGTAGSPSASTSSVTASPTTITAGTGSSTITVTVRDDGNNPVSGVSVTVASSGSENSISPASASTGSNGVATFTFSSTVAETKTISATAGGVAITDGATITVQKAGSVVEITSDEPDPSSAGQSVRVEFTVTGSGGTPTGDVTVTVGGGTETCMGTLAAGSGFCDVTLVVPGTGSNNRRVLTATYPGDARFSGDTDTENHRVNPLPNNSPTAEFTADCTGLTCQFTDQSSDTDGTIASWSWNFGDNTPTSSEEDPVHTYAEGGTYSVMLTVTDDDGAQSSVTHEVTVTAPTPTNTPPSAEFSFSCTGLTCSFIDESTDSDGDVNAWSWNFGDSNSTDNTSEAQNPEHTFSAPGEFTVTLVATDDDGADSPPHSETVTVTE
ncbi:MAG: Ig-like domain-containing protein [Gemmatimonadales bacterium]